MKNKQVKQMMCDVLEGIILYHTGEEYRFKFIGGRLSCDYGGGWGFGDAVPFYYPVSIKACNYEK